MLVFGIEVSSPSPNIHLMVKWGQRRPGRVQQDSDVQKQSCIFLGATGFSVASGIDEQKE